MLHLADASLQPPAYDDAAAAALQATQVSILSVMNCAGRIVIGEWRWSCYLAWKCHPSHCSLTLPYLGLASDFVKTRLGRVRSVLLVGVALSLFVSQVLAGEWSFALRWRSRTSKTVVADSIRSLSR